MDTGDLLDALRARRIVELMYRSRGDVRRRVVHPHAVYRTSAGKLYMDAIQVSGDTRSGSLPGWRQFELMRIADLRVLDASFGLAPDYDPASERYRHGLLASA